MSTDASLLDIDAVHGFLDRSYWASGRSRELVERSIRASMPFGLYHDDGGRLRQLGFARVVTDGATFAWLGDVFVAEEARGTGLGVWLVECVMEHPDFADLKRILLATRDAHGLYERFGFRRLQEPDRWMERRKQT